MATHTNLIFPRKRELGGGVRLVPVPRPLSRPWRASMPTDPPTCHSTCRPRAPPHPPFPLCRTLRATGLPAARLSASLPQSVQGGTVGRDWIVAREGASQGLRALAGFSAIAPRSCLLGGDRGTKTRKEGGPWRGVFKAWSCLSILGPQRRAVGGHSQCPLGSSHSLVSTRHCFGHQGNMREDRFLPCGAGILG